MRYPKVTREKICEHTYAMFCQLREIKAKDVKDTIIAYDDLNLIVNVDIGKNKKPCGVEILYYEPSD